MYEARLEELVSIGVHVGDQYDTVLVDTVPNHSILEPRGGRGDDWGREGERGGERERERTHHWREASGGC